MRRTFRILWLFTATVAVAEDSTEPEEDGPAIVVQGRRDPADPKTSGSSVTTIQIDDRLPVGDDLSHVVERAPGTTVRRLGGLGGLSAVSLRGSALRQVQVFIDGLPLNPDGGSAVNLTELPMSAFDRVEVWRGGGPASLAASPMGGVVSLHTADDAQVPLTIDAGHGSWGSWSGSVRGADARGPVHVMGSVGGLTSRADYISLDDNRTPFNVTDDRIGPRQNNDRHQLNGVVRLRDGNGGRWSVLGAFAAREEGIPGAFGNIPDGRLRTRWAHAAARLDVGTAADVRAWAQVRNEVRTPKSASATREDQLRLGVHGHARATLGDTVDVGGTAQARVDLRAGRSKADVFSVPERARRLTQTVVADAHWTPHTNLSMDSVLQIQGWTERGSGLNRSDFALNPRLSARYTAHRRVVLHTAAGRAVRPPDFLELFGDRGGVQGRPDLLPERSWWADVGVRWLGEPASVELNLFINDAFDRIVFVENGSRTLIPINVGHSRSQGVEFAVDATPTSWSDLRVSTTLTDARDLVSWRPRLARIPLFSSHIDGGVNIGEIARASYSVDVVAGTPWDSAGLFIGPTRVLHSAAVRVRPPAPWPEVSLDVRNLSDRFAQFMPADPAFPDGDQALRPLNDFAGYPLPGRTFMLNVRWTPGTMP
ncbi:MAG: TonB-dependent receptor plug domain-containing protein [Myxococcota bacterium]